MGRALAWLVFLCALPLAAQSNNDSYAGTRACRACQPDQFTRQSASPHARALSRAPDHPLASRFAPAERPQRPSNFHFQFRRTIQGFSVRADDSQYVTELPLEWAFGAGEHAVTFVTRVDAQYYLEHSFSYYADTKSLDLTPRHAVLPAKNLH